MEDLPAIIHRLSLRLWSPEFEELETEERLEGNHDTTAPIDPLASPPQDAVDAFGNPLDESQISALSLDSPGEIHASFSQKNILRLAALSESQRTLSLFTPGIRDAVFRAWAGHSDKPDSGAATPALTQGSLSRIQSTFGSLKSNTSSVASGSTGNGTHSSRPTMASSQSMSAGLSLGANRSRTGGMRKRKKRVVDLRKKDGAESSGVSTEANTPLPSTYVSETSSVIPEEREADEELATPPRNPAKPGLLFEGRHGNLDVGAPSHLSENTPTTTPILAPAPLLSEPPKASKSKQTAQSSKRPPLSRSELRKVQQSTSPLLRSLSFDKVPSLASPPYVESTSSSGGILEQAWMLKMAQEIARKVQEEKDRSDRSPSRPSQPRRQTEKAVATGGMWASEDEMEAPPAYVA